MAEQKTPNKKNIILRILALLVTAALVAGAVALVAFRDRLNIDALRRWFTYYTLERNDSGQAESFFYDGDVSDIFRDVEGDLLVCSANTISLYSGSGVRYVEQSVTMADPAVDVSGGTAVVYDAGGTSLYVLQDRAVVFTLSGEENTILAASLSEEGELAVVTHESGYRGVVTVYQADFTPRLSLRLSSRFVLDAALSGDGDTLAIVTADQEGGSFVSTLELYDLTGGVSAQEPAASAALDLGGSVSLALEVESGAVWALGDRGLTLAGGDGTVVALQNWSDRYIKNFSLEGSGFAAALLGKYRAGSQAELLVVDETGTPASLEIREQVLSISAAGRYLAVLTADRLDIYTAGLTLYSALEGTQGARKVLLREDGSAILIGTDSARLYIPQ